MPTFQMQLTVPTDARPANVAVSNQTLRIGASTLAGAGGWRPTLLGSPVYYTISGGNSASYSVNAITGKISPKTDGAATTGHTFTFTAYGSIGPGVTATITISAPANTYSVTLGTEIRAAVLAHASSGSVATSIEPRPGITITDAVLGVGGAGTLDQTTFNNRLFSSKPLTIISEDTSNPATIQNYQARVQGSDSLLFKYVNFTKTDLSAGYPFIFDNGVGTTTNITVENCNFSGPTASVLEAFTGGVKYQLYDWYANVIDTGGPQLNGGANPFPSGISLADTQNATVRFNYGTRLNISGSFLMKGTVLIEGNTSFSTYYDAYNISGLTVDDSGIKTIKNNTASVVFGGRFGAANGPHPDSYQFVINTGDIVMNVTMDGNVGCMGAYGTDSNNDYGMNGPFSSGGKYKNCVFRRMVIGGQSVHGITGPVTENVMVDQCTLVENDPLNPVAPGYKLQIKLGETSSTGVVHIRDSVIASGTTPTTNGGELTIENLLNNVVTTAASAAFTGPFAPVTRAQTIAAFTPKVGGAAENIGAVTTGGAIRSDARKPAVPAKPGLATAASSAITVTPNAAFWAGDSAVTSRDLCYSTDEVTWTTMTGVTTPQTTPSLTPTTLYYVQTRDVNSAGPGAWSKSATITTT